MKQASRRNRSSRACGVTWSEPGFRTRAPPGIATVRERFVERGTTIRRHCRHPRSADNTPGTKHAPPLVRRVANSATVMRRSTPNTTGGPHPMTVRSRTTPDVDLVEVAYAQNETEA